MLRKLSRKGGISKSETIASQTGASDSVSDGGARKASHKSLDFYRSGAARKGSICRKGTAHRESLVGRTSDANAMATPSASRAVLLNAASFSSASSSASVSRSPPTLPPRITSADGEQLRQKMRAFVSGDIKTFRPENIVSYATGRRSNPHGDGFIDDEGTGPGMYFALWIAQILHDSGQDCFSGLCVGAGTDWKIFVDKLKDSRCKRLFVVQTCALFDSRPCLQEIYEALQAGIDVIPIIFEKGALEAPHWPHISPTDVQGQEWLAVVNDGYFKLNSVPSPPLTVLDDQRAFFEIVDNIALATESDSLTDASTLILDSASSSDDGIKHLRAGMKELRDALAHRSGSNGCNQSKREAGLRRAEPELRAAVKAAEAGTIHHDGNIERAHCCFALCLFAQGCIALNARRSQQAHELLDKAIKLVPGLSDTRRDQARRYHAYALYANAKELLQACNFKEALAIFEALLSPCGETLHWLDPKHEAAAKRYQNQCKSALSAADIERVGQWIETFDVQFLTQALHDLGADMNDDVKLLLELDDADKQSLREPLPPLKQKKFDKAFAAIKQMHTPHVPRTEYLMPETVQMSDQTQSVVGKTITGVAHSGEPGTPAQVDSSAIMTRRVLPMSTSSTVPTTRFVKEHGMAPEHAVGDTIEVWRYGKDVIDCKIMQELGRGAQAIVYRVISEGGACALKVASVLPVADEARALLRVNSPQRHPNVLQARFVCSPANGDDELVFLQELIEGESLAALIASGALYATDDAVQSDAEPILQRRLGGMFVQLLAALAHVHSCGVLHQDVKPDNIMVNIRTWQLHLIDFGIATIADDGQYNGKGLVNAQMRGGTAAFVSPLQGKVMRSARETRDTTERRELLQRKKLSQHVDIWGAAATCLEMFCGSGRWRYERQSADAWHDMGRSLTGLQPGVMRVVLPEALVSVVEQCLNNTDAAYPGHELTAQHAADAAATACACVASASDAGLRPALAGAMHANIALALHKRERTAQAEACYRDAVAATQSRDPRVLNNLGVLCAQGSREAEAYLCFELAIKIDASYQEANANLAQLRGGNSRGTASAKFVLDERAGAAAAFDGPQAAGNGDACLAGAVQPVRHVAGQRFRMLVPNAARTVLADVEVAEDAGSDGVTRLTIGPIQPNLSGAVEVHKDESCGKLIELNEVTLQESELVAHHARTGAYNWRELTANDASSIDIGTRLRGYSKPYHGSGVPPPWIEATVESLNFAMHLSFLNVCELPHAVRADGGDSDTFHTRIIDHNQPGRDAVLALVRDACPTLEVITEPLVGLAANIRDAATDQLDKAVPQQMLAAHPELRDINNEMHALGVAGKGRAYILWPLRWTDLSRGATAPVNARVVQYTTVAKWATHPPLPHSCQSSFGTKWHVDISLGVLVVDTVLDGSPAHRQGLRDGDEIIEICNSTTRGTDGCIVTAQWVKPSTESVGALQLSESLLRARRPALTESMPPAFLQAAEPTPQQLCGGTHWLGCQAIDLCPAVTAWRVRKYGGSNEVIDLLPDASCWVLAPVFRYCTDQPLRVWEQKQAFEHNVYPEVVASLRFAVGRWCESKSTATNSGGAATGYQCEAHHAPALLTPSAQTAERTRFVRHVQDKLGTHVDAFSGKAMDLRAQMATIQYKEGAERQALLVDTDPKDFEDFDADVLERQRKGSIVAEIRSGAVDASQLLDDVMAPSPEWAQGCYATQPCVVVLGPAASGKTTLLRRFVVEAVERPEEVVPIFSTVIDIVRLAQEECTCESSIVEDTAAELFEAMVAHTASAGGTLRQRYIAQAIMERRALFLIDGMDEAGQQAELVEAMLVQQVVGRGHRLIVTTRHSGFSDGLRRALARNHCRIVQLLPLHKMQQQAMIAARVPDAAHAQAFTAAVDEPRLAELAQNPLMLTMLLSVFKEHGSLPEKRSELYKAALHAMLERVDTASKGGHGALDLEPCLWRVAWGSHARAKGEQFRIFKANANAAQWASTGADSSGEANDNCQDSDQSDWARVMKLTRAGAMPVLALLGTDNSGDQELRFSHLTFQEYFVAEEISRRLKEHDPSTRAALLRNLLRQNDRRCAAHAIEEPRWQVVLETCDELCNTPEEFRIPLVCACQQPPFCDLSTKRCSSRYCLQERMNVLEQAKCAALWAASFATDADAENSVRRLVELGADVRDREHYVCELSEHSWVTPLHLATATVAKAHSGVAVGVINALVCNGACELCPHITGTRCGPWEVLRSASTSSNSQVAGCEESAVCATSLNNGTFFELRDKGIVKCTAMLSSSGEHAFVASTDLGWLQQQVQGRQQRSLFTGRGPHKQKSCRINTRNFGMSQTFDVAVTADIFLTGMTGQTRWTPERVYAVYFKRGSYTADGGQTVHEADAWTQIYSGSHGDGDGKSVKPLAIEFPAPIPLANGETFALHYHCRDWNINYTLECSTSYSEADDFESVSDDALTIMEGRMSFDTEPLTFRTKPPGQKQPEGFSRSFYCGSIEYVSASENK